MFDYSVCQTTNFPELGMSGPSYRYLDINFFGYKKRKNTNFPGTLLCVHQTNTWTPVFQELFFGYLFSYEKNSVLFLFISLDCLEEDPRETNGQKSPRKEAELLTNVLP